MNGNSGSNSDESEKRRDPDFYQRPVRVTPRNHPKRVIKKKEKNDSEAGSASSTRNRRRQRNATPRFGVCKRRETNNEVKEVRTTLLFWLVINNIIRENTKVFCVKESFGGHVRKGGILCICCNTIFSPLKFVTHNMKVRSVTPYDNIFIADSRIPLLTLLENALRSVGLFGPNGTIANGPIIQDHDDVCISCADGGNLMCCDACKSVYHAKCMGLKGVPDGSWFCPYCICKFCKGPFLEIPITCSQCEKKYHLTCYQEANTENARSWSMPLCDANCSEVLTRLRSVVGAPQQLADGFSWMLLRPKEVVGAEMKNYRIIECHSKLALAMQILNQSFEPVTDRLTGINMIENVVYSRGSNCYRLNYSGFYTAILEKDEEIVSVASLRFHGREFVEMPFIVTSDRHRKQGNCRMLLSAIEAELRHLKVPNLVLPSTDATSSQWENYYGFKLADIAMTKELMERNALTFCKSVWLQKKFAVNPERGEASESSRANFSGRNLFDLNKEPPEEPQDS